MNRLNHYRSGLLRAFVCSADRRLAIVAGLHPRDFGTVQLWPQEPPVIGAQILSGYGTIRREFQADAVLRAWSAVGISMSPLPQLGITLNGIAEGSHAQAELCDTESAGGGKVLVECHGFLSVANGSSVEACATHVKHQSLRVARATLPS